MLWWRKEFNIVPQPSWQPLGETCFILRASSFSSLLGVRLIFFHISALLFSLLFTNLFHVFPIYIQYIYSRAYIYIYDYNREEVELHLPGARIAMRRFIIQSRRRISNGTRKSEQHKEMDLGQLFSVPELTRCRLML